MIPGFPGSVTSTAVTFLGGDSWASHSTRRPPRVSWMAMPSPQLPNPFSGSWASKRMLSADSPAMGPDSSSARSHSAPLSARSRAAGRPISAACLTPCPSARQWSHETDCCGCPRDDPGASGDRPDRRPDGGDRAPAAGCHDAAGRGPAGDGAAGREPAAAAGPEPAVPASSAAAAGPAASSAELPPGRRHVRLPSRQSPPAPQRNVRSQGSRSEWRGRPAERDPVRNAPTCRAVTRRRAPRSRAGAEPGPDGRSSRPGSPRSCGSG